MEMVGGRAAGGQRKGESAFEGSATFSSCQHDDLDREGTKVQALPGHGCGQAAVGQRAAARCREEVGKRRLWMISVSSLRVHHSDALRKWTRAH